MAANEVQCADCRCVIAAPIAPHVTVLGSELCPGCAERRDLGAEELLGGLNPLCAPIASGLWLSRHLHRRDAS